MSSIQIARHRTALTRHELSRPLRLAINDGLLDSSSTAFDYGCGRGGDVQHLRSRGIECTGWDPNYSPDEKCTPADVVNLGYVINVIENPDERASVLKQAWSLAQKVLIVSARLSAEARENNFASFEDGFITRRLTFQKYYDQQELRNWIDSVLGESSVAAGPGIFYVFRDQNIRQTFVASKYRRAIAAPRLRRGDLIFERHKTLFEPLMTFITSRGRLPIESELDAACDIVKEIGSLKHAFKIIRGVTGEQQWEEIREARSQDLLIYLALSRFGGRPRFSQLSCDLQLDLRAFFSTYTRACELADNLLFSAGDPNTISNSCRESSVGKLTPGSLYVHVSAIPFLSPTLRIYEGCARAYIGAVEGANIVKLNHRWPQVSYLAYPEFERDPHPVLFASLVVPLQTFHIQYREYAQSANPPILHRKETFLPPNHPMRQRFERLTRQEEKYGLYEDTHTIGTKDGWEAALSKRGLSLSGHRVVRRKSPINH
ncbi:MAG TPA: DNA phosphorothioation-associated putative methyltransferase [Pyrinomonadaceae bacterium]